jgi:hypothetical protein
MRDAHHHPMKTLAHHPAHRASSSQVITPELGEGFPMNARSKGIENPVTQIATLMLPISGQRPLEGHRNVPPESEVVSDGVISGQRPF